MKTRWDIFCNVVDNFGDIGVSWRLARQLANEHGLDVRLWVDDLASFRRICPDASFNEIQHCREVEVRHWGAAFPEVEPGGVVIESFGCRLPESFLEKMAGMAQQPVWINLEYLSAEDWVGACHLMPSPHPKLPLVKYFFFPGFSSATGGLLVERDLLARRNAFLNDTQAMLLFWASLGGKPAGALCVSLFCYENPALESLLDAWSAGGEKILCLVPEGGVASRIAPLFGADQAEAGARFSRGSLEVRVIPFVEQEDYDLLLWASDLNFVRGEDSFVRAQWAGKALVWNIYPQDEAIHLKKLEAFMSLYCQDSSASVAGAVHRMWRAWNGVGKVSGAWAEFVGVKPLLDYHAREWAEKISKNNLAANLVDFCKGKR